MDLDYDISLNLDAAFIHLEAAYNEVENPFLKKEMIELLRDFSGQFFPDTHYPNPNDSLETKDKYKDKLVESNLDGAYEFLSYCLDLSSDHDFLKQIRIYLTRIDSIMAKAPTQEDQYNKDSWKYDEGYINYRTKVKPLYYNSNSNAPLDERGRGLTAKRLPYFQPKNKM